MWFSKKPEISPDPAAVAARKRAEQQLEEGRADASRIEALTAEWRRIRARNHFAAAINATFRGGEQ